MRALIVALCILGSWAVVAGVALVIGASKAPAWSDAIALLFAFVCFMLAGMAHYRDR